MMPGLNRQRLFALGLFGAGGSLLAFGCSFGWRFLGLRLWLTRLALWRGQALMLWRAAHLEHLFVAAIGARALRSRRAVLKKNWPGIEQLVFAPAFKTKCFHKIWIFAAGAHRR